MIFASLTRISNLPEVEFHISPIEKSQWRNADYVAVQVTQSLGAAKLELNNGRQMDPLVGETVIGALGVRHATLEATGSWEHADPKEEMELLTGAGLTGKMTSLSPFCPSPIRVRYLGHVLIDGKTTNMADYVSHDSSVPLNIPVVLITGTSMTAGKTTVGKIAVNQLAKMGLKVLGAKLTGAGRYRDILAMKDAGAHQIIDFVESGLPSSICSEEEYEKAVDIMISKMAHTDCDVAVVEIGASPYEPYNGNLAIQKIKELIRYRIICTADPYAAYGVIRGFDFFPDLISGPCTNTLASVELVEKITGIKAMNLLDSKNCSLLAQQLKQKLSI